MKRLTAFLLALLLFLMANACAPQAQEPSAESEYGLWFAVLSDSGRSDYSAVARENRVWGREPTAEELLLTLLEGPEGDGLYAPFPRGVKVQSITLHEASRLAQVDMSESYGGLGGFELTLADYCIALTLCQLPQVETVSITVNGKPIAYRDRQELQAGDVMLSGIAEEPDTFLATLYFPAHGGGSLEKEYRQVTRSGSSLPVEIVMAELLRGPTDSAGCAPLPVGTQVLDLETEDGICRVDLSEEFLTNAPTGEKQAGLTLYALVNSLCALAGVSQVRLLIDGETVESYGGISVSTPLSANFDLAGD